MELVSLEDNLKPEDFGDWLADEVDPPTANDVSIAEAASEIHRAISQHVPLDRAEDWVGFEVFLPKAAARPKVGDESSGARQEPILPALRENVVSEENVTRIRLKEGKDNEEAGKKTGSVDNYNEDSIQFFREDFDPRFDWRLAEEWAQRYRRDAQFILRGIMACRECCVSPTWFLHRYLERNKDAPRREDVEEAHRRILAEAQTKCE